jgi:hypothetical protein
VVAVSEWDCAVLDQQLTDEIGLGLPSAHAADVDRTADARLITVKDLNNYCHSVLNGMDLAAGDDSDHRTKPYLLADPAHAHLARRAFAAAATQNLQSSVSTIGASDLASSAHHAKYSHAEEKDVEVVVVEGPLDTRNTSTAFPPAVNVADVTSANPSAFSSKAMVQQARVELAAKFLFIFALIDKVVVAAAHCYRLQQRVEVKYREQTPSLTKTMEPRQPAMQLQDAELARASLSQSLLSFDRAKAALHWLRRDYELSYATYRVNELLMWTKDARNEHLYNIDTLPTATKHKDTGDNLVDSGTLNDNEKDIHQLNTLLQVLLRKAAEVEVAVERNEKSSLDIALDYLDDDGDGHVRAEDCSEEDQQLLFPTLSGRHEYITRKSMRQGMLKLSETIERNSNKMAQINALGIHLGIKEKGEFETALDQFQTDRSRLRRIHQSLHQAFVHHLFADLTKNVTQSAVHIERIRRDIVEMEARVSEAMDPMTQEHLFAGEPKPTDHRVQTKLVSNVKVLPHTGSTAGLVARPS